MTPSEEPRRGGWRRAFRLPPSRAQAERELDDEIAFHLAMREQKLRAGGLTDTGAYRRARERFGDVG
ncbi:MAG TPA: permease prefix domain 1-containing protein, partial [Gemmatimonadaceae bacterium]|nr:permease prefix domain 1-containing protein [Gemmatimonadaceae bacterium]